MKYSIVIAGLPTKLFDRVRQISGNLLAPKGGLIITPVSGNVPYTAKYIEKLLAASYEFARTQDGHDGVATLLIYVDYADQSTKDLLQAFFPFSLPLALDPLDIEQARNRSEEKSMLNGFAKEVEDAAIYLRGLSAIVSDFTSVANLTPLLLPLKNFRSNHLRQMIEALYFGLADSDAPKEMISSAVKRFFGAHPRTHRDNEDRHCFSDGYLYFRSPGKDRHGFFRNGADSAHSLACLLNARSRIGGRFPSTFHFDCVAVRGSLASQYLNCHSDHTRPADPINVNIAPNDFVR